METADYLHRKQKQLESCRCDIRDVAREIWGLFAFEIFVAALACLATYPWSNVSAFEMGVLHGSALFFLLSLFFCSGSERQSETRYGELEKEMSDLLKEIEIIKRVLQEGRDW